MPEEKTVAVGSALDVLASHATHTNADHAAPGELLETRVLLTVMGGRETYRASGFGDSSAGRRAAWTPRASPHGWVYGVPADESPNPDALKR